MQALPPLCWKEGVTSVVQLIDRCAVGEGSVYKCYIVIVTYVYSHTIIYVMYIVSCILMCKDCCKLADLVHSACVLRMCTGVTRICVHCSQFTAPHNKILLRTVVHNV